jgi:uncharacterized membrane protein YphA (DoxX/SURF4 family)
MAVDTARVALRLSAVATGVFFLAMGLNKLHWIAHPDLLSQRFEQWLPGAAPYARWYLQTIAIPAAPLLARVVPIAELCAALALITGMGTNVVAAAAFVMVVNFHIATSAISSSDFLRDGTGPPLLGILLALAIAGHQLPFSISALRMRR